MESEALPHEYTVEKTAGSRGEATGAEGARYVLVPRCGSACLRGDHESLCSQVCREWRKGNHDSPPTSKPVRTLPNRQHAGEYIKVDAIRPERISGQTSGQLGPSIEIPVEGQWSRVYLDRLCAEGSTVSLTEEHYKDLVAQDRREVYWRCSCGTGHFVSAGCAAKTIEKHERSEAHRQRIPPQGFQQIQQHNPYAQPDPYGQHLTYQGLGISRALSLCRRLACADSFPTARCISRKWTDSLSS